MKRTGARLILEDGSELALAEGVQTLGRSKTSGLVIHGGSLSKQHLQLTLEGATLSVVDLDSRNGTTLNGESIRTATVANGDSLCCGMVKLVVAGLAEVAKASGTFLRFLDDDTIVELAAGDVITVGSKSSNGVVIKGREGVSRYHAELVYEEATWWIKDLGARNGVEVGGERIEDVRALKPGDEIKLGTCRLRFEQVEPNPLASARDAILALRGDPVGALKNDPRVRRGLAAAVVAALLLLLALPGSPVAVVGPGSNSAWLAEGSAHLVAGDYERARVVFRRAKQVSSDASVLERIATQWKGLETDGPRSFRWEKAGELLTRTARIADAPAGLRAWVNEQTVLVDLNTKACAVMEQADEQARVARERATAGELDGALDGYLQAATSYDAVSPESLFADAARTTAAELSAEAFSRVTDDLREGARKQRPNWPELLARIDGAQRFATSGGDRALLRRLGEACRGNIADERRFVAAGKLIKTQDPREFAQARKILGQVDARSKIYADSQAYLDWLDADAKVRDAIRAYRRADDRTAFALLKDAYRSPSLGAPAKKSISIRRTQWKRVVRSYERGMEYAHAGEAAQAIGELERVLELEQDPKNLYRTRAQAELVHIRGDQNESLRRRLTSGLAALQRGRLRVALDWFEEVRGDRNHVERDLEQIRNAVAQADARDHLLTKAKRQLIQDNSENFLELRSVFGLLARWLPTQHAGRPQAEKHLRVVVARIRAWQKAVQEGSLK